MLQMELRYGDPLAPFLFTIMAEGLSDLMREAVSRNLYRGFNVGTMKVEVNLLQYANDTIFVGKFNVDNVVVLKSMIKYFELVSDLKVNFHKSRFGGIVVEIREVERFSQYLNCKFFSIPFVYLGIPINANPRRMETWEPIIKKN